MHFNKQFISVIIINWNGKKWLKDCFDSLMSQTYINFEIIFVDNNSKDDSIDFVEKNYPEVIIVKNKENCGFGKANNLGVAIAKGNVIFFLNNDTILENNTLEKLLKYKKDNNLNIVGSKILDYNKQDIYSGRNLSIDFTGYLGWGSQTFYIEGCALMITKNDFLKLRGFDEKYFMYSEDIDLCWRAHLYDMKIEVCNDVSIIHFGGGSSEKTKYEEGTKYIMPIFRRYEVEKNNLRNVLKNYSFVNLFWVLPFYIFQNIGELVVYLFTGNFKISKVVFRALWWNVHNINDTINQRKIIQKERVVGDLQILKKMNFKLNKLRAFLVVGMPEFK